MVRRVKPYATEDTILGSVDQSEMVEIDPNNVYLAAKGISFEASNSFLHHKLGRVILETYPDIYQSINYNANKTLNYIEYYNSASFITANRLARTDMTYTAALYPSTEITRIYDTDGSTILKTHTISYTFSSGDMTQSSELIS